MTSRNDITGDPIKSRSPNDKFREGYDRVFGERRRVAPEFKCGNCEDRGYYVSDLGGRIRCWCTARLTIDVLREG